MHRDGDIDPAAIAEADAVAGAVEDRHLGAQPGGFDDAFDRIVAAGLAGHAAQEHDLARDRYFRNQD